MSHALESALVLQAASLALQYPDRRIRLSFTVIRDALQAAPRGVPRDRLLDFVTQADHWSGADLEQHYVEVFDRNRRCSLYLTWWTEGETRRRGLALARLKALYRSRGQEFTGSELPDFLPVICEFAASTDLALGLEILQQHRAGLELLRLALLDLGTPYAGPVAAVCAMLPGPSPSDEAAARALARIGPPTETVGLPGFSADRMPDDDLGPTSLEPTGVRR